MLRWPGMINADQTLNGIQAHMDMFTSLATAAGRQDVNAQVMRTESKQYIDGVDHLDWWLGKSNGVQRARPFFYYYESKMMAVRMGPWKWHFATKEDYYAPWVTQSFPVIFNLNADPFESWDSQADRSGTLQRKQWLNEPVQELLGEHVKSLKEFPPVQKAASFDFSKIVDSLMSGAQ